MHRITWDEFTAQWHRAVRHVVLGAAARDDTLGEQLTKLRAAANWAFFRKPRTTLLDTFRRRLTERIANAPAESLAGMLRERETGDTSAATDQVTHWLFAFDAACMAAWRALALLASHPDAMRSATAQSTAADQPQPPWPFIRATILESLRLWPTTPAILRETVREDADRPLPGTLEHTQLAFGLTPT